MITIDDVCSPDILSMSREPRDVLNRSAVLSFFVLRTPARNNKRTIRRDADGSTLSVVLTRSRGREPGADGGSHLG